MTVASEATGNVTSRVGAMLEAARERLVRLSAAEIPAANGHGNARSVAEIHSLFVNGGMAKGKRFLALAGEERIVFDQDLAYVEDESARHRRKGGED